MMLGVLLMDSMYHLCSQFISSYHAVVCL